MSKHLLASLLVILLSLPLVLPFMKNGFFPTHDGGWAVVRLAEMHRELRDLQIPPRWSGYLNHGYGYPLFLFSYPLPYYTAEIFHLAGLGLIDSIKAVFVVATFASGLLMFLLGRELWGIKGGLISSILYLYVPYRMTNLYVRGSLGESLASLFFPLLFYLVYRLGKKPSQMFFIFTIVVLAAFILTHNVMVLLFMPLLLVWCVVNFLGNKHGNRWQIKPVIFAFVIAICLSAFFWLPVLVEKKFLALSLIPIAQRGDHFLKPSQLFSSPWQYSVTPPLFVGGLHLIAGVTGTILLLRDKKTRFLAGFLGAGLLLSLFMLFPQSFSLWELPLLSHIDFPWRVLGIIIFLLAFLGGALASIKGSSVVCVGVICATILLNASFIKTEPQEDKTDTYYETNDATTTSMDEFMPIWVKVKATDRPTTKILLDAGTAETIKDSSDDLKFYVNLPRSGNAVVHQLYFPGWTAFVDNNEIPITPTAQTGLIGITLPEGDHELDLRFTQTPVRRIADSISLVGVLIVISTFLWSKKLFRT